MSRVLVINAHPGHRVRKEIVSGAVNRVLRAEKQPKARLSVILAGGGFVRALNRQYLRHDYDTDVLSFCLESGKNLEGEIYVNLDRARQQARSYRVELRDEIIRLAVHGTLHLVGYDDTAVEDARVMKQREEEHVAYWRRRRRI